MRLAKVLVLDLNPSGNSGGALRDILEACPAKDGVELKSEIVSGGECPGEVLKIVSSAGPDILFLVPSQGPQGAVLELFGPREYGNPTAPVIVVSETGGADEMFEWLKLGAADFITAPLRDGDVLPRVWQQLE